jgi:DNA-binding transcriptional ArsR family regulator
MKYDIEHFEFIRDKYSKLILKSTLFPKSAIKISEDTDIPLNTVHERLEILGKCGFLQISEFFKNGIRVKKYHNKTRKYHISNPRIVLLLNIIQKNPGIGYRGIQKLSGYPQGTLTNSLFNLEKDSMIISKRSPRRTNYFPAYIPSEEYLTLINLRKETAKRIILFLMANNKGKFSQLKTIVNKSAPTVSYTLTILIEHRIIRRVPGLQPYFELQDPKTIKNAVDRIEPTVVDKMKDRFVDTFSYL